MSEARNAIKAEALREAAEDFRRAAASGVEPVLNLTAARLLFSRAERVEAGERGYSIISPVTREITNRTPELEPNEVPSADGWEYRAQHREYTAGIKDWAGWTTFELARWAVEHWGGGWIERRRKPGVPEPVDGEGVSK